MAAESIAERAAALQKDLRVKKSFVAACQTLAQLCEDEGLPQSPQASAALADAGKVAFTVLQARFSNPKFWQAGLDFFLALEFHLPEAAPKAETWREAAMAEVDEEVRERAKAQAELNKLKEDRKHNKGRWSDENTPVTQQELAMAAGMLLVDADDDGRPPMSRDERDSLKMVTVLEEDKCVVCLEPMLAGSKAKAMPCGHKFHDDCLTSWVQKHNSCPTCRFDEMKSEKRHFDDVQRQVQESAPNGGMYG